MLPNEIVEETSHALLSIWGGGKEEHCGDGHQPFHTDRKSIFSVTNAEVGEKFFALLRRLSSDYYAFERAEQGCSMAREDVYEIVEGGGMAII